MIEDLDFETYLKISSDEFSIYLFDIKNKNCLYSKEVKYELNDDHLEIEILSTFLENNIFKIEKLVGKFIKNIFLVIENKKILNLNLSIQKKNYNEKINNNYLNDVLAEAKDLFKENYQDQKILHMLLVKYFIDGEENLSFSEGLQGNNLRLEIKFISLSQNICDKLSKLLENYQIKIVRFIDQKYIQDFYEGKQFEFPLMINKIKSGENHNEVNLVPKSNKKKGFFEKFFQLFS